MRTTWFSGLSKDEKAEIKKDFLSSLQLRKRLVYIAKSRIESAREKTVSADMYNSPSWAYVQADNVGYERAMREIINLLESNGLKDDD